jgi:predicted CXXCH cytochrome family protein
MGLGRDWAVIALFAVPAYAAGVPGYAGAGACTRCHQEAHRVWAESRHSKMVQPASVQGVKGDFSRGRIELRGQTYLLRRTAAAFYITESYLYGKPVEHRVDYTLGNRRIQHYLTTLADGKIVVLPPSWDIVRQQWFHNLDIDDPEEAPGVQVQVWNKNCYSCHVSQEQKNFDQAKDRYQTAWLNFGINCERCHGPGAAHVAHYSANPARPEPGDIVMQTRLDPMRNTMVCAQCHSFRDIEADGYTAGANYYDYFLPVLEYSLPAEQEAAYWPDGRTRRFSNDALGLWQSECFLKGGATCLDCHVIPHNTDVDRNPQLRPDANALCTRCHAKIGQQLTAHTHHGERSSGSSCVECHMPRTVYSIKAEIRDHSMSIPVPENTLHHGIPNACNVCHKDRDAAWALAKMNQWYGSASRQKLIRRADAFSLARAGDLKAVPLLLAIFADRAEGGLARANAVGYLTRFTRDPAVFAARMQALRDSEPLVRAVAALGWGNVPGDRQTVVTTLIGALADPAAVVRLRAMVSLVELGVRELPGEDGERLERAKQMYNARAQLGSDDPGQLVAAGEFYFVAADPLRAIAALQSSLKLDPTAPAQYFLAGAYLEQNDTDRARAVLLTIPPGDPQYQKAQRLLKVIADKTGK